MRQLRMHAGTAHGRFCLAWLGMIVLFWGLVLVYTRTTADAPPFGAAFRNSLPESRGILWRYTGSRPGDGEVLRIHARTATQRTDDAIRILAYPGTESRPDPDRAWHNSGVLDPGSIIDRVYTDIPPWPEGESLWVGVEFRPGGVTWIEPGDPGWLGLGVPAYLIPKTGSSFAPTEQPWIPGLGLRVVPKDSRPPGPLAGLVLIGLFGVLAAAALPWLRGYRRWWFCGMLVHGVLLMKAVEALSPSPWWWGGYYLERQGRTLFWIGLGFLTILLWPPVLSRVERLAPSIRNARTRRGVYTMLTSLVGLGLLLGTCCFWSRGVYGDGYGSLGFPGYDYHNPFATAIYHLFRDVFLGIVQWKGLTFNGGYADFRLIPRFVIAWLPVYTFFVALIAIDLGRTTREAVLVFLLFMSFKGVVTFFGYVEVYGPSLAIQAVVLWSVLRAYRSGRVLLATDLSFFGYLFHMAGAMVLPAVAGVWIRAFTRSGSRGRWVVTRLAASVFLALVIWGLCLSTLYIFKHDMSDESFALHVPAPRGERYAHLHGLPMLYGSTGLPGNQVFLRWSEPLHFTHFHAFPTWEHASQIGGAMVFIGGPVLFLWLAGAVLVARRRWRNPEFWGFAATALAMVAGAIVLATSFPYPKDWDVLAIQQFWWLMALLWLVIRGGFLTSRAARWLLLALLLYFLWDTIPWLLYNLSWGLPAAERKFVFL